MTIDVFRNEPAADETVISELHIAYTKETGLHITHKGGAMDLASILGMSIQSDSTLYEALIILHSIFFKSKA